MCASSLAVLAALAVCGPISSSGPTPTTLDTLRASLRQNSDEVIRTPAAHPFPNHIAEAALAKLLTTDGPGLFLDVEGAEKVLQYAFLHSGDFGLSFGGQFAAPMLRRYGRSLSPGVYQNLTSRLCSALPATGDLPAGVDVSYTNIYLMEAVNLVAIGGALADTCPRAANATASGFRQLDLWFNYTHTAGIHEYTSPTYTWVQFDALYLGQLYAPDAAYRARFRSVLDHIWGQIGANWFEGGQARLSLPPWHLSSAAPDPSRSPTRCSCCPARTAATTISSSAKARCWSISTSTASTRFLTRCTHDCYLIYNVDSFVCLLRSLLSC